MNAAAGDAIGLDPAFFDALEALGREIRADCSAADLKHLRRIERIGRSATLVGWATSWMGPNLVSAALLAQGRTTRWTTVAHHISHDGYKRVPGAGSRRSRKGFARGWRRAIDWLDVIVPEAWHEEHNVLHHARTGEHADPDFVQDNLGWMRDSELPRGAKLALLAVMAASWKWIYYAPNVLQDLFAAEARRAGIEDARLSLRDPAVWDPRTQKGRALWTRSFLPYALVQFVVLPAFFLPLGPLAVASSASNSLLAELLTNLHTFLIITTNHAGRDVSAFATAPRSRRDFFYRQIAGSVNYRTGGDLNDMLHGWLNYQIEHHVWPDLTLLQYRKVQPKLKALCEEYGVPYVQESVWVRLQRTLEIMVGDHAMREDPGVC